ncbi:putative glycine--tRNA ligase [Rosa chinensis]|uniref:Putative glycine--tRNA ligase n=1 Tax=Rosa chinensis TaxID=74649 RepID=A0A2P6PQF2_ROSCH|nr:putative glycine--tRNA ligase [Rosa chinensis]
MRMHPHFRYQLVTVCSAEDPFRKALSEKVSKVERQGNQVPAVKKAGAAKTVLDVAIEAMNALKLEKASIEKDLQATISGSVNKEALRQAVIYSGGAGLYDYGPPGFAVKSNVLGFWLQHFLLEENMFEVDCPCVTYT